LLGALAGNLFETGEGDGIVDSRPPFGTCQIEDAAEARGRPFSVICPLAAACRPARMEISVVLPAPFGPSRP